MESYLSGEYPAATGRNLEVPGASVNGDSDWSRSLRALAVVNFRAELPWINLSMISVRAEI